MILEKALLQALQTSKKSLRKYRRFLTILFAFSAVPDSLETRRNSADGNSLKEFEKNTR